ncbi:UPF0225 protein YchJ [Vibrio variabilis]|uniref:UPF0225 protein YchJ n=1 Tax=Vibrio variabilis TaxID=990271 RepID=A0ABQ0JA49_9VIBR|nr:UPF0225 protein YchJ [Vibrio variabilis]
MNYQECCQPIHNDVTLAKKPEQLMRARYSAHLTKNVDFVVATYHLTVTPNKTDKPSRIPSTVTGRGSKSLTAKMGFTRTKAM